MKILVVCLQDGGIYLPQIPEGVGVIVRDYDDPAKNIEGIEDEEGYGYTGFFMTDDYEMRDIPIALQKDIPPLIEEILDAG